MPSDVKSGGMYLINTTAEISRWHRLLEDVEYRWCESVHRANITRRHDVPCLGSRAEFGAAQANGPQGGPVPVVFLGLIIAVKSEFGRTFTNARQDLRFEKVFMLN